MKKVFWLLVVALLLSGMVHTQTVSAQETPVVHGVLFYSPTCPHCQRLLAEGLPPLMDQYGDQLQILLINVSVPAGSALYQATVEWQQIQPDMQGVPTLVVDDQILVGEVDIPARLPAIVDAGLERGGIDWPAIPGFAQVMKTLEVETPQPETPSQNAEEAAPMQSAANPLAQPPLISEAPSTPWERAQQDVVGSALAIIILVGMMLTLIWVLFFWWQYGLMPDSARPWQAWVVLVLLLAGLAVSLYLSFIETTHTEAICGPVGNCNAVQQSPYARLFGVLPVGVLGAVGYVFMLAVWAWQRLVRSERSYRWAWLLPAATFFGVVFSMYLTFLEPFVIGAVCIWCLSSAVIVTALLWLTYRRPLISLEPETEEVWQD